MGIPLKLLIIEDSANDADLIVLKLKKSGYDVSYERIEDGPQMWQALKEQTWDVIISDHNLPQFDSLRALQILKDGGLDVPFIIVSGAIGEEIAVKAMKSGAKDYLNKNDLARLPAAVEREVADARDRKFRKQAETALRQNEERFRLTFDQSPIGAAITSLDFHFTRVNETFCRMTGYSKEELAGLTFKDITHPEDLPRDAEQVRRLAAGEIERYETDKRYVRKDGSVFWGHISFGLLKDAGGNPLYYIPLIVDITERKQAEKELKKRELRLASIFSTTSVGIAMSVNRVIKEVNDAFCIILKYNREELINRQTRFLYPNDEEYLRAGEVYQVLARRAEANIEVRMLRKDGRIISVILGAISLEIWHPEKGVTFTIMDITARKKAEEALRTVSEHQDTILDAVPDIIMEVDNNRIYTWANKSGIDFFGDDVLGRDASYFFEGAQDTYGIVKPIFNGSGGVIYIESCQRRKDGEKRLLAWWCHSLKDDNGTIIGALSAAQDITERKKAEEALRESEARYRALTDLGANVGEAVVMLQDLDGREGIQTFVNDRWPFITGYSHKELVGMSFFDLLRPDFRYGSLARHRHKMSGESLPGLFEMVIMRKDGGEIPIELTSAFTIYQGKPATVAYIRDITERKKAEEEIKESEEKYRLITQNMSEMVVLLDMENRVTFISPSFERLRGFTLENMKALPPEKNMKPASWDMLQKEMARQLTPERLADKGSRISFKLELELYRKDGSSFWVEDTFTLIRNKDGDPSSIMIVSRDISKRKKVEEKLQESEGKFRNLADQSPNIIFIHSGGRIAYVNNTAVQMMGYSKKELYSPEFNFLDLIAPEFREQFKASFAEHMKGTETPSVEYVIVAKDSKRIDAILTTKLIDYEGRRGILGTITDISDRKQAEAEARRLEEKAQVASRLAAVGEMAAGIAHEINNPLTAVLGFSELLLEQDLPREAMEEIRIIADGSRRVADIVKRLLTFARQNKPIRTALNINALIDNTLKLRTYVLQTTNISVYACYDQELPWIVADPGQLQQVFLNLIVNAEQSMKSAHNGGQLKIITEKRDNRIRIVFQDDGLGITKKNMGRLFEPFFTTKGPGEGTGLGLSLSRSIVIEHGGEMWAESEPGHGATFIVELPLSETPAPQESARPSQSTVPATQAKTAKILVVDDETSVREYFQAALTAAGHSVDCTCDAEEALNILGDNNYDVIFIDIRMPGMSGTELYGRILQMAPALARKIIFMTGDTSDAGVRAFLTRNNLPYLAKPFDVGTLEEKIRSILTAE